MSQFSEDDLERIVREALAAEREVPAAWREAARAAYTWRTVDEELLALTHDSMLEAGAALRGADEERTLEFSGAGFTLSVELTGRRLSGQLSTEGAGEVVLEHADGGARSTVLDDSGFFTLESVDEGLARFSVRSGQERMVTEWVSF